MSTGPADQEEGKGESKQGVITVPVASFIEDVEQYLKGKTVDDALKQLNSDLQKYKLIEQELAQKQADLLAKVPQLKKTLAAVTLLQAKGEGEETLLDYNLSEQIYARARLRNVSHVGLALGAGIIVEYPLGDAKTLVEENLAAAEAQLQSTRQDAEILKDFSTITEVSLARVFNHDVARKRRSKGPAVETL